MKHDFFHDYWKQGFLFLKDYPIFLSNEMEHVIYQSPFSVKFYEADNYNIRSFYGFHRDPKMKEWIESQKTIQMICQYFYDNQDIYIHQSKLNIKNSSQHSVWPFHRDFPFWNIFDGIRKNELLNIVIFLDDVDETDGALQLIPQTHQLFLERENEFSQVAFSLEGSASHQLLFDFSDQEVDEFSKKLGIYTCTGTKGSILIFDPNIIHGSFPASENSTRKLLILTFNTCDNLPKIPTNRPEYLCSTDFSPLSWIQNEKQS